MAHSIDITLYGHWICPFVKRVKFALAERDIPFDEVEVPPSAMRPPGWQPPPEFVRYSRRNEIPMIRHRDHYLPDSIPILRYLEDAFTENPLLPPEGPEREKVLERVQWLDTNVMMPAIRVYYGMQPAWVETGSRDLAEAFQTIDAWLGESPWLCGNEPTLAEAIVIPIYVRLDGMFRLGLQWNGPEAPVRAHMERCRELRGWPAVAWSQEQEDEFVNRFLKARRLYQEQHG